MPRVKRSGRVGACLLFVLATCGSAHADPVYLRIATFNIANFGATDEYERSLIGLVNIIRGANADVLALQEVEPNARGSQQVARLAKLLNKAADHYGTPQYEYVIPEERAGDECVAFFWRPPAALQSPPTLLAHHPDPDGNGVPVFQRVPTLAFFRAGNFDFMLLNCHLYTKVKGVTSEGRLEECETIAQWLHGIAEGHERDAVVVGDFNRFLNGKEPWRRFAALAREGKYRFPLLEAIRREVPAFDPAESDPPDRRYSTNAGKKLTLYDQIIVSAGVTQELAKEPRFGEDVGIVAFDESPHYEWFMGDWRSATAILSDHRPVWIRLRIDLPDDD